MLGQLQWYLIDADFEDGFHINIELLGSGAVATFLTTLVIGAILVAFAPEWVTGHIEDLVSDPVGSFVYGLICLFGLVVLIIALFLTLIGILVLIPLVIVAYFVWAVGSALAFLTIGVRVLGEDPTETELDNWLKPLLVGAACNGVLALTGIGAIFSFLIGAAGFGVVVRDLLNR